MKKKSLLLVTLACGVLFSSSVFANDIEIENLDVCNEYYSFTLDGTEYTLPFGISDLISNGWSFYYDMSDEMIPGMTYYMSTKMVKDDKSIFIEPWNPNGGIVPMADGLVASVRVVQDSGVDFATYDGIGIGSAVSDAEGKRGTNEDTSQSEFTYRYKVPQEGLVIRMMGSYDGDNITRFKWDDSQETITEIELEYFRFPEDADLSVSDERPAYLDTYVRPDGLGSRLEDMTFELNGELMQFPIPADVFLQQMGCTLKDETVSIPAQSYRTTSVYDEEGSSQSISIHNNADYMTTAYNGFLNNIDINFGPNDNIDEMKDAFVLSGNVYPGMPEKDLFEVCPQLAAISDDSIEENGFSYRKDPSSDYVSYTIKNLETDQSFRIKVNDTQGVFGIGIQASSKWGLE